MSELVQLSLQDPRRYQGTGFILVPKTSPRFSPIQCSLPPFPQKLLNSFCSNRNVRQQLYSDYTITFWLISCNACADFNLNFNQKIHHLFSICCTRCLMCLSASRQSSHHTIMLLPWLSSVQEIKLSSLIRLRTENKKLQSLIYIDLLEVRFSSCGLLGVVTQYTTWYNCLSTLEEDTVGC